MDDKVRERLSAIFGTKGFDKTMAGLELLEADGGHCKLRITVDESLQNLFGSLHGGAIATIVDDAGTMAIMSGDRDGRPGVTTDLNVTYMTAAKAGEVVLVDAQVLKTGRTMAFVSVDLRRERDGALVAQGRMTKFLAI